ncbi:MAG TPA: prepilin-type N-terminal cleavage/methylation domain-containing protein [Candidatus Pacearchaeota archaeon]|nr:prepilin-type N-terminal cleavage/methylation domain-containing protein [Candidatus Pacearchaeota archaeon]
MINRNKQQSFTLIELLVVIVIIGILAGVIMISTSSSIDKASIAKSKVFEESVKNNLIVNLVSALSFDSLSGIVNSGTSINDDEGNYSGVFGTNSTDTENRLREGSECVKGKCLLYKGNGGSAGDYINLGENRDFKKEITISAWVKVLGQGYNTLAHIALDTWGSGYWITLCKGDVGTSNYNMFRIQGVGEARFYIFPTDDKWHHVVAYYNGEEMGFYIDSKLVVSKPISNSPNALDPTYFIIGKTVNDYYYFNGMMDELYFFNSALTNSEIKQNYIAGLNSMLSNGNISNKEYNERINELAYMK